MFGWNAIEASNRLDLSQIKGTGPDGRIVKPFWRRDRITWPASEAGVMEARVAAAELATAPPGAPAVR